MKHTRSTHKGFFSSEISRRDFLKNSMKGAAVLGIPIILSPSARNVLLAGTGNEDASLKNYYNHFGVDSTIIRQVMETALDNGGDYCDLFFEHTTVNIIGLEDKQVNRAVATVELGVGIRVIKGDSTGYSFTQEITPEAMKLAAKTAAAIAEGGKKSTPVDVALHKIPDYYPVQTLWSDVTTNTRIPILEKMNDAAFTADSRIIKVGCTLADSESYILIATSEGRIVHDYRPMLRLGINCNAEQNGKKENFARSYSVRSGIEAITPERIAKIVSDTVESTMRQFEAIQPEGGEMPVVLAKGSSGILLHEAIGHGMEADFNRKNESIFSDKVGKKVAESFVTIVDDGTMKATRGTINVDDEANDSQRTVLVENGILRSYMHDHISANFYKVQPTGNGRRESFKYSPIPRMRNTYMTDGPHTREEIIKSTKKGIIAEQFTNGQVNIGPGDFTFYVKSGYLIEDGKITRPIKDINIIGNGPDVLGKIVMVANDFEIDDSGWTCGKGQSAPVSLGMPTVKVSSINVGGVHK